MLPHPTELKEASYRSAFPKALFFPFSSCLRLCRHCADFFFVSKSQFDLCWGDTSLPFSPQAKQTIFSWSRLCRTYTAVSLLKIVYSILCLRCAYLCGQGENKRETKVHKIHALKKNKVIYLGYAQRGHTPLLLRWPICWLRLVASLERKSVWWHGLRLSMIHFQRLFSVRLWEVSRVSFLGSSFVSKFLASALPEPFFHLVPPLCHGSRFKTPSDGTKCKALVNSSR